MRGSVFAGGWSAVVAIGLAGCAKASGPPSDAPDAHEAGLAGPDGEAPDASELDATTTRSDADATLEDATPDASSLQDAASDDRDLDASTLDAASPEDSGDSSAPDASGPVDAAGLRDAPSESGGSEASDGLPSTAPCLTGGHVMWVEGDPGSYFFTGTQTDAIGSAWAVEAEEYYAMFDGALIEVTPPPSAGAGGAGWFLNFNTWNTMTRMQTGVVYDVATEANSDSFGYTRTCQSAAGKFRIDEFEAPDASVGGVSMLVGFTAAFAITCDGYPGVLRGCVHF